MPSPADAAAAAGPPPRPGPAGADISQLADVCTPMSPAL
jgi:hypothetical protein